VNLNLSPSDRVIGSGTLASAADFSGERQFAATKARLMEVADFVAVLRMNGSSMNLALSGCARIGQIGSAIPP